MGGPSVEGEDRAVAGPRVEGEVRAVGGPSIEGETSMGVVGVVEMVWRRLQVERKSSGQAVSLTLLSSHFKRILGQQLQSVLTPQSCCCLFTPQLMKHIVVETNRFTSLCVSATHRGDGPILTWETSVDELKAYFGFQILMGFNRLPEIRDYWSTNSYFHYFPIASRISRNRFLEIQRFLYFVDNSTIASRGEPEYDRLAKVRPVIKSLQRSFFESYKPHRENAIDEAMIKFKGRSSIEQYLPKKPVKRGFKVWVRADSINGYTCDFDVYTGKQDAPQKNLGVNVVRKLLSH